MGKERRALHRIANAPAEGRKILREGRAKDLEAPREGFSTPLISCKSVDFPLPLGPTMAEVCPARQGEGKLAQHHCLAIALFDLMKGDRGVRHSPHRCRRCA